MTLEKIRKMSDDEFINYAKQFTEIDEYLINCDSKLANKIINIGSVISGVLTGFTLSEALDYVTNDKIKLMAAFVIGTVAGIPVAKKTIKYFCDKCNNAFIEDEKNNLIELKEELESLNNEQFELLINMNEDADVYNLHEKMINIFNGDSLIKDLEVSYKDEEKDLGYSKNIIKNN